MKGKIHYPVEQYGFAEIEFEVPTGFAVRQIYDEISNAFKPQPKNELPDDEWNKCLDLYRKGEGLPMNCEERMSPRQKWLIHELDKSDNRTKYRLNRITNSKE